MIIALLPDLKGCISTSPKDTFGGFRLVLREQKIQNASSTEGYLRVHDAVLAQRVQQMDDDSVAFASQRGLLFHKDNVLDHQDNVRHGEDQR